MKFWRFMQKVTFVAGLLGVSVWLGSIGATTLFQVWQNWVFDQELQGQPASFDRFVVQEAAKGKQGIVDLLARWNPGLVGPPPRNDSARVRPTVPPPAQHSAPVRPTVPDSGLIGRLTIPRLHLSAMVREGVGEKTLRLALGHIPGTALPGAPGNIGVAGHRDTLFRALRKIRQADLIRLESQAGTYVFRVEETKIVSPRNTSVLRVGLQPELTLVTCYPFYYIGAAPKRFIVRAHQISASPRAASEPHQQGS